MPIIGLNYRKINAEKKGATINNMKINTGPEITGIKKSKLQGLDNDIEMLSVDFRFKSDIEPKIGSINIEGTIVYKTDKTEEIMTLWNKNKSLPEYAHIELINYIFKKVGILALQLSDILQFPPVISMPKLEAAKPAKKETKK
ncbi:MAG: hypothetical protein ABIG84_05665 [archaeon]